MPAEGNTHVWVAIQWVSEFNHANASWKTVFQVQHGKMPGEPSACILAFTHPAEIRDFLIFNAQLPIRVKVRVRHVRQVREATGKR